MKKKIFALLLVIALFISVATNTVLASENPSNSDSEFLFEHLLKDINGPYVYNEAYYHHVDKNDPESEIDWAVVYVLSDPVPSGASTIVSDRVISTTNIYDKYPFGWCVYDAQLQEFISIDKVDTSKYEDFEIGLEQAEVGNPFGDADMDGTLTVLDATYIQQVLVNQRAFSEFDIIPCGIIGVSFSEPHYISDIDGDGERSIMDATAIQQKLAKK